MFTLHIFIKILSQMLTIRLIFFKIVNGHCLDCIILSVSLRVKKQYANETLSYIFKK